MAKQSAGILLYKLIAGQPYFLLAHPGGPFWKNKDIGSWSIPKGEFLDDESPLEAAVREFEEETSERLSGHFTELQPVKLKSGKIIYGFALEKDIDATALRSNEFQMEWPPKSGIVQSFPEIDKARWFPLDDALKRINPAQADFILQVVSMLTNRN